MKIIIDTAENRERYILTNISKIIEGSFEGHAYSNRYVSYIHVRSDGVVTCHSDKMKSERANQAVLDIPYGSDVRLYYDGYRNLAFIEKLTVEGGK